MKRKLQDIVKGIYSCYDQQEYISEILSEVQRECGSKKEQDKLNGIQKLSILYLKGVDVKQFGFATLDCISSSDLKVKRWGYFISNFTFGREETRTLSTNSYIRDIKHKDQEIRHMSLSSLVSCTTPQKEQVYALFPVLFEQLRDESVGKVDLRLLSKLIATILHLLIASQKNGIENLQEYVNIFIDLLIQIQQSEKTATLRVNIPFMQLWARTGLELGVHLGFGSVMKLVPIYADLLLNQASPWVITYVVAFLGRSAAYDQRVAYKISNNISYLLQNTESKSLQMELAKQIFIGFNTNQELISLATSRISKFVVKNSHHQSDSNLRALALKNLASLEKASPGSLMRVEQLPQELLKSLADTDFNQRILVLDVIQCLATHQYVDNIINTLLTNLQNTKTLSEGESLQQLHKQSSEDVKTFRQNTVRIVIELITNPDLIQSIPVQKVLGVLSTLIIEYPSEASSVFCHGALKLMGNQNIASEWKEIFVLLTSIVLNDDSIYQYAFLPGAKKSEVRQLYAFEGPIQINQRTTSLNESLIYTQMNQLQESSLQQLINIDNSTTSKQIQKLFSSNLSGIDFYKDFIKFAEFDTGSLKFKQNQIWLSDGADLISKDQAEMLLAVNNILQTSAYILGSYFVYQQGGDGAVSVHVAIQCLFEACLRYQAHGKIILPIQTSYTFIIMAIKLFTTSLIVMLENELFAQEEVAEQFVTQQFAGEFAIMKQLTLEEAKMLKEKKKQEEILSYDPFGTQDEEGEETYELEVLQASQTLINMYVKTYAYCINSLKQLASMPDLALICNQCYKMLCISYQTLYKLVDEIQENEALKTELNELLDNLNIKIEEEEDNEAQKASSKEITENLLQIQSTNDFNSFLKAEKPHFAFEDGTVFNLSDSNSGVLSRYDMFTYQPEEWQFLLKQEKISLKIQNNIESNQQALENIFSPTQKSNNEPIQSTSKQEKSQTPASIIDSNKEVMDQLFGQPKKENNVYILNQPKQQKKGLQINKYIQNIQIKKEIQPQSTQALQVQQKQQEEQKQEQQNVNQENNEPENEAKQQEHRSKKRKHKHKHQKKEETEVENPENKSQDAQ